jgi:two-component system response regulator AdeR
VELTPTLTPGIALVRYPAGAERLADLRRHRVPRLLLVAVDADPPIASDVEEDWIREPADPRDLEARITGLLGRIAPREPDHPVLDDSLLRLGSRWVALSPIEARIAAPLVARMGAVISRESLAKAAWPDQRVPPNTLNVHLSNLRRRLQELGLAVVPVRSRGYLLQKIDAMPRDGGRLAAVAPLAQ